MAANKTKMLLIGHEYHTKAFQKGWYDALGRVFDLTTLMVEQHWPTSVRDIPEYNQYAVIVWYVRFRELAVKDSFDWGDFEGKRLMYDEDAHAHFHLMLAPRWLGKWPEVFHRNQFELLITTGRETRDVLIQDGVPSFWLPKAYDPSRLYDKNQDRRGNCYFGNRYTARRAMLDYVARRKQKIETFVCQQDELNDYLNKYVGCLICNMSGVVKPGLGRLIHKFYPSRGIRLGPGAEPMLKNFEVAGAGCAPIADKIDELSELGFVDGVNIVLYENFAELSSKLAHYEANMPRLREIGMNAAKLAKERHTWDHRASALAACLESL